MQQTQNNKTEGSDKPTADIGSSKPKSSLAGALMRTFRGDITQELGDEAPDIVNQLVPGSVLSSENNAEQEATIAIKQASPDEAANKQRSAKPDSLLHTYRGDVQQLVKRRKLSLMRMAASEVDSKDGPKQSSYYVEKSSTHNMMQVMLISLVLVGAVALTGIYYMSSLRGQAVGTQLQHNSLIFAESVETVDTTEKSPRALKQMLANMSKGNYYSFGSVVELIPVKVHRSEEFANDETVALSAKQFLTLLDTKLPTRFIDVFRGKFMLGFYSRKSNIPFIILQTNLYDYAFEGMLTWETYIEQDLAPLFSPGADYTEPAIFAAGSLFTDTVMNNLDVRVLRDSNGDVRLLYSFVNKNTIIITTDVQAFIELSGRLHVAQ